MSISSCTSCVAQATVENSASIFVARKAMDAAKLQGDAAIALLKQAAEIAKNPPVMDDDGRVDIRA